MAARFYLLLWGQISFSNTTNFAEGSGEGMSVESAEIKSEIHNTDNTGLNIMALNIFSLMPHLDELRIFLNEQRPHIIGITETKTDSTIDNSHIEIDDYVVERNDSVTG